MELSQKDLETDFSNTDAYIGKQDAGKNREATELAHFILDEILAFIKPGIKESEVKAFSEERFEAHHIERPWHLPYIRFGENTLMTFRNKATNDLILEANDIAFADIGIVREGVEGDAGRTVAFGSDPLFHDLQKASELIFTEAVAFWKQNNPTGEALYEFTHSLAKKRGFVFNLDPAGHLIGTFPHRGWKRGINHYPHTIATGVWILEIQIRHPTLPYGAFFEDILI